MDTLLIIMAGLILAGTVLTFISTRKSQQVAPQDKETYEKILRLEERIGHLNEKSGEMTKMLDNKMAESTKAMQDQFGHSAKIVQDVTERLTKLDETNKQVLGFSEQLNKLQDTLNNPKQRGILGEYYLEETLKNVLPPNSYQMQYKFKNGDIVDAVVFVKEKIIPVDSKFSLENYKRIVEETDPIRKEEFEKAFKQDLKNRIDETSKYVRPREKTMEFAFMFIPSEAIYYDLLVNKVGAVKVATRDLIEYAFKEKHVIIVSPTSFLAYLQTVLQGLRALQIEESAQEIKKGVGNLSKHIMSYKSYMDKLGVQIGTTVNTYNTAYKEFKKLDKDTNKIAGVGGDFDLVEIDKPKEE
ncbi:MAG: DNA recombination protein RmuC [Candidatus Kerfeldbacteria bacterium]